ncbi:MAG: MerR family transcriptional regulator [Paracoccus sp. (in: a-proteobacteria)]
MAKGAEAFRSIGEVAKLIGVAPHVLRYWETQFGLLKPMKRGDGRRYYRPDDVRLAAGLCEVLRDEGLTIRGARKLLARDRGEAVRARGALKLGEALEADTAGDDGVAAVETVAVARPATRSEDAASLSDQDEPARGPRSRNRKRPATREPDPLPLFPEDAGSRRPAVATLRPGPVDAVQAGWMAELTRMGADLRAVPAGARLSAAARGQALRLMDAIADHY